MLLKNVEEKVNELIKDIIIGIVIGSILTYFIPKIITIFRTLLPGQGKIKKIIEKGINEELRPKFEKICGLPVLRYGIKVEWDEKVDKSTYLTGEGELVVKLSYTQDKNQSRSFTKALMLYLEEAFIPESKPFVGRDIREGCKCTIAKEVTLKKDVESYRHFLSDYLSPLLCDNRSLEQLMSKLELVSHRGCFYGVLLREIYILCESGNLPRTEIREEVGRFIEYLWNISNKEEYEREHGEEPELNFIRRYIKMAIVLVKRRETGSLSPHIRAGERAFTDGAKRVYVNGWGEFNIKSTKKVAETLASRGFNLKGEHKFNANFPDKVMPGICFILER